MQCRGGEGHLRRGNQDEWDTETKRRSVPGEWMYLSTSTGFESIAFNLLHACLCISIMPNFPNYRKVFKARYPLLQIITVWYLALNLRFIKRIEREHYDHYQIFLKKHPLAKKGSNVTSTTLRNECGYFACSHPPRGERQTAEAGLVRQLFGDKFTR